jgi:hypothetical protein
MKDGEFGETDKKLAVMTIFSSLNWMPNWFNPTNQLDLDHVSNQLADLLINGLKKQ